MSKISKKDQDIRGYKIIGIGACVLLLCGLTYWVNSKNHSCMDNNDTSQIVMLIKGSLIEAEYSIIKTKIEEMLKNEVKKDDLFSIYLIQKASIAPKSLISKCSPGRGEEWSSITKNTSNKEKEYKKKFVKPILDKIEGLKKKYSEGGITPIIESIKQITILDKFSPKVKERKLIIFSDMLQKSEILNHYKNEYSFENFKTTSGYKDNLSDLSGVDLKVYYMFTSPEYQCNQHIVFWRDYFKETRSNKIEFYKVEGNVIDKLQTEGITAAKCGHKPSTPVNFNLTAGDERIDLAWESIKEAKHYDVFWSTDPGVTKIKNAGKKENIKTNSFKHTGLTNGTNYYYIVTASNDVGESYPSDEKTAKPSRPTILAYECPTGMGLVAAGEYYIPSKLRENLEHIGDPIRIVKSFCIQNGEVTIGEFRQFMRGEEDHISIESNTPVENISWDSAVAYAKWLSQRTGRKFYVPTTKQWAAAVIKYAEAFPVLASDEIPYTRLRNGNKPDHLIGNLREWSLDSCGKYGKRLLGENNMADFHGNRDSCGRGGSEGASKGVGFRLIRE